MRLSSLKTKRGFTLVELITATAITLVLAGILISVTTGILTSWDGARATVTTGNFAKFSIDRVVADLESLVLRADGNVWLAATIQPDQSGTGDTGALMASWSATGGGVLKPGNGNGSLIVRPAGSDIALENQPLKDFRFGMAGIWLRMISHTRGSNDSSQLQSFSAPTAVAYQIIRYNINTSGPAIPRYGLFRSEVRPFHSSSTTAGRSTFAVGYDVFQADYNNPSDVNSGEAEPGGIRRPDRTLVVADNVIDFGVRLWGRDSSDNLVVIFPEDPPKSGFAAVAAIGTPPVAPGLFPTDMTHGIPEVAEIFVRVLTDQGAELIEALETGKAGVRPADYATDADWWWGIAERHSQVFTRRVQIRGNPL